MYKHSILLTEDQIQFRIAELANTLNHDYRGRTLEAVCVLKGGLFLAADLVRRLDVPVKLHFVQAASYGNSTESSGTIDLGYSSIKDVQDLEERKNTIQMVLMDKMMIGLLLNDQLDLLPPFIFGVYLQRHI